MRHNSWAFRRRERTNIAQIASVSDGAYGPPRPHSARMSNRPMSSAPDDVLHLLRHRGRNLDPSTLDSLMRAVPPPPTALPLPECADLTHPKPHTHFTQ